LKWTEASYSKHFEAPSDGASNATFASTASYAAFTVAPYAAFNVVYFNLHQSNGLKALQPCSYHFLCLRICLEHRKCQFSYRNCSSFHISFCILDHHLFLPSSKPSF